MDLVERAGQAARLDDALDAAAGGRGQLVMLSGPIGSGKSRLLHAFGEAAEARDGLRLLRAQASHSESALPGGVIGQLLSPVIPGNRPSPLAAAQVDEMCAPLLDLAVARPLVVVVDDVHLADPESMQCLAYVARRLHSRRLLLVCSETTEFEHTAPESYMDMLRNPNCTLVNLPLLSMRGVAELAAATGPRRRAAGGDDHLLVALRELGGGNPLLTEGLLEDQRAVGRLDLAGSGFGRAVRSFLCHCPPPVVDVLRALAVLKETATRPLLERMTGSPADRIQQTVRSLETAGLLQGMRFRHGHAATVILSGTGPDERATLHARAARLLYERAAPAIEVARRLLDAGAIDDEWAVTVLHQAADDAQRDGDCQLAVSCLELACRLGRDDAGRLRSQAALARAEWRINPVRAGRHMPALAEAALDGRLTGPHAIVPVKWLLWFGRWREARRVLQSVANAGDARTVLFWAGWICPSLSGDDDRRLPGEHRVTALALSPQRHAADVLRAVLDRGGSPSTAAEAEQILHTGWAAANTMTTVVALLSLIYGDRPASCVTWCDKLLQDDATNQSPTRRALLTTVLSAAALRQGRLDEAVEQAGLALAILENDGWGVAVAAPMSVLIQSYVAMGRLDEATEVVNRPTPDGLFDSTLGALYLEARGRYFGATDRPAAALLDARSCGELLAEWGLDSPSLLPWRSDAAAALRRLGRRAEAEELVRAQLERLGPHHTRSRGLSLHAAALTWPRRRSKLLLQAADALRTGDDRLSLAHVLADLADTRGAVGDPGHARAIRRQAYELAEWCGARALAERLRGEIDREESRSGRHEPSASTPAPREPEADQLHRVSEAERRVALLAADGYTNRQIADRLCITMSTVEQHLTRVYRKLDIRGRSDLPVLLLPRLAGIA